jgi:hypothetical protein
MSGYCFLPEDNNSKPGKTSKKREKTNYYVVSKRNRKKHTIHQFFHISSNSHQRIELYFKKKWIFVSITIERIKYTKNS